MKQTNAQNKPNIAENKTITIEGITTNKYLIIYTDNCEINIQKHNEDLFFPQKSLLFVERGIKFSCRIKKILSDKRPYRVIRLDKEELIILKDVFKATNHYYLDEKTINRKPCNKIIGVKGCQEHIEKFNRIESTEERPLRIIELANIILLIEKAKYIINSVIVSAAITFTDKVRNIIENNISRKWRLSMIADEFNISEISVRKRLESEGTSFNNLLTDIRMNKSMHLLLENEMQIHQISRDVGIFSLSYFIKTFKNHFGITPKQFIIYFRS